MSLEKKLSKHHIIPRSRGGKEKDNIVNINNQRHNLYHQLFENKIPEEIGEYLSDYFWGNKYEVEIYRK